MSKSSRYSPQPGDRVKIRGTLWDSLSGTVLEVNDCSLSWVALTVFVEVVTPDDGLNYHCEKLWFAPKELKRS